MVILLNSIKNDIEREIEQENAKWAAAVNSGNPHALAQLVSEDFVYIEPGHEPVHGRDALVGKAKEWIESGFQNEFLETICCFGGGDLLVQWARFSVDIPAPGEDRLTSETGNFVDIFLRKSDGAIERRVQMLCY